MGETCHYCAAPATQTDHIIPRSLGGPDREWNRQEAQEQSAQAARERERHHSARALHFAVVADSMAYSA
jgi:5-methylcytosine-specific restriction endonuclease McrA